MRLMSKNYSWKIVFIISSVIYFRWFLFTHEINEINGIKSQTGLQNVCCY